MYDPSKYGAEFGSELRKRQTPEMARRRRRQGLLGLLFGTAFGIVILVEAIHAIRTGQMVRSSPTSLPISGYEAAAIALFFLFFCLFALWRTLRNRD